MYNYAVDWQCRARNAESALLKMEEERDEWKKLARRWQRLFNFPYKIWLIIHKDDMQNGTLPGDVDIIRWMCKEILRLRSKKEA